MHQSHGCGFAEYERDLEKRLDVEKVRDMEYKKGLEIAANANRNHTP
ncbi:MULTISPECIES: hypothetical protein [Fictibacillus]|nr:MULTISPECIES: hypothetical protein [unclassified Fictibacillus]MBH0157115.1 hypothetical protein [Fictibacillus sp. 5RED26]MBH0159437.1 hypothetical protein [Fictibacillus sp. 26RED30]MBH0174109.1 hypothetical protein [Fictibacillus sp. 23RED33]